MPGSSEAVISFLTSPVDFCNANMIRVRGDLSAEGFGKANKFTLVDVTGTAATCVNTSDNPCNVYSLSKAADSDTTVIHAYFCDYTGGQIRHQILSKAAAICFTITMDGCTFGIGSSTPTGCVLVTHANATGAHPDIADLGERAAANIQTQKDWTLADLGADATLLEPTAYRPAGEQIATTFGVREGSGWDFYYQSYRRLATRYPTPYKLLGCTKFT